MMEDMQWLEDGSLALPLFQFRTGYVIELEYRRYFSGIRRGRVCCMPLNGAKHFPTMEKAVDYVHRHLGFAGLRVHICRACWTLVELESIEEEWRFLTGRDGRTVKFATYQDVRRYQMEESLQNISMVEFYVFLEKEMFLAA